MFLESFRFLFYLLFAPTQYIICLILGIIWMICVTFDISDEYLINYFGLIVLLFPMFLIGVTLNIILYYYILKFCFNWIKNV